MKTIRPGMSGSNIMEIQALLKKMGYPIEKVDGTYGEAAERATRAFQKDHNLAQDGIIGPGTLDVLKKYLLGYTAYRLKSGDTYYRIARRTGTQVEAIETANPGLNPNALPVGRHIIIPYPYNVVDTNINYTYDVLEHDIMGLAARYPFLQVGVAGKSVLNRNLYYLRLGTGSHQVFYNAAHHALEWITSPVLMKFVEDFCHAYAYGRSIAGYSPESIWNKSSIFLVPMVNPDGVDLVLNGLSPDNPYYNDLIAWNMGSDDFSRTWQSNNHGVDLNHNYDAAWEESVKAAAQMGITGPGPRRYPGPFAESEPETRSMTAFTRSRDFRLMLAYHSQGRVIFWNFMGLADEKARQIGLALAQDSGYKLEEAEGIASTGGYKDWFVQEYRRPGYTVEVGEGQNPLPIEQFDAIYADNIKLLLHAAVL